MTTATSAALDAYLSSHSFLAITDATSLVAILLLVFIVVEREIVRMSEPEHARRNITTFAIVALPAFFIFASVVIIRFIKLS